jgi:hypothetical protein
MLIDVKLSVKVTSFNWKPVNENEDRKFWDEQKLFGLDKPLRMLKL